MTAPAGDDLTIGDVAVEEQPADDDGAVRPDRRSLREWTADRTPAQVVLVTLVVVWTQFFTRRTLDIHHGLGTSSYDSALYDQGIWLLSRFETPFVTLMGRNLFGDHTSFVLLFLVPVYWVFPAAGTLFFAQAAAIGSAAVPVFLAARRQLANEWWALVCAVAYLAHPAVGWTNMENFHPDAFVAPFVGFAIYFALERRWRPYAAFVVLALLVKEDVSLVVVPLGVWVALRRDRRVGLLTVVGSISFMLVAMFVVMRSLIGVPTRNTWRIPFGGPTGVVRTALTRPRRLFDHLRSDDRPFYVWQMIAPFGALFTRRVGVAAISFLVIFTNVLSTFWYQYQIEYHYGLIAVPALAIGTASSIAAIERRRLRHLAVGVLGMTSLVTAYLWSPFPGAREYPTAYWPPSHPVAEDMRAIIADIPGDAVVSAYHRVTAHMAHREQIYMFPNPFRTELYGSDPDLLDVRLPEADEVEYVVLPANLDAVMASDWASIEDAFVLVAENSAWRVYQRDFDISLPSGARLLPSP
jgi:uncharacterized membrane protein